MRTRSLAVAAIVLLASCQRSSSSESAYLHFKLRPGNEASALSGESEALFSRPAALLKQDAALHGGPDLSLWRRVAVPKAQVAARLRDLKTRPEVHSAFVAPKAELPTARSFDDGSSCPIRTPAYDERQGYLGPSPGGIGVEFAWAVPGGRGQGVWFADVEGGWNADHEDLPGERMEHVGGTREGGRYWVAHGTAVLGEVVARDNGLGMTGIVPEVDRVFTSSIHGLNPAAAIDAAASVLRPGDVLLIELHSIGPRGRYLPMEFWDDVFDAIQAATRRGVVVIEAAGNGGENLDHAAYRGKLSRPGRESGAIMVGASAPNRPGWVPGSRLDFSNYGTRLDLQGWGRHVASLDYGDLQDCAERRQRDYTDQFSGTSSASPIVTGAAIAVQGVHRAKRGTPLAPLELRELLVRTGTPQRDGPNGSAIDTPIGPLPNLARALAE